MIYTHASKYNYPNKVVPVQVANKYGSELDQNKQYDTYHKQRRSDMRACFAICLSRRGWTPQEISDIMDESYDLNVQCKAEGSSPFVKMQELTGLTKI